MFWDLTHTDNHHLHHASCWLVMLVLGASHQNDLHLLLRLSGSPGFNAKTFHCTMSTSYKLGLHLGFGLSQAIHFTRFQCSTDSNASWTHPNTLIFTLDLGYHKKFISPDSNASWTHPNSLIFTLDLGYHKQFISPDSNASWTHPNRLIFTLDLGYHKQFISPDSNASWTHPNSLIFTLDVGYHKQFISPDFSAQKIPLHLDRDSWSWTYHRSLPFTLDLGYHAVTWPPHILMDNRSSMAITYNILGEHYMHGQTRRTKFLAAFRLQWER